MVRSRAMFLLDLSWPPFASSIVHNLLQASFVQNLSKATMLASLRRGAVLSRRALSTTEMHGTTILCVRRKGRVCLIGDGQVSMGSIVVKGNAKKVRRVGDDVLVTIIRNVAIHVLINAGVDAMILEGIGAEDDEVRTGSLCHRQHRALEERDVVPVRAHVHVVVAMLVE